MALGTGTDARARQGTICPARGGVVLHVRDAGGRDQAVAGFAVSLAVALGATLRTVHRPRAARLPATAVDLASLEAIARAADESCADWIVVGTQAGSRSAFAGPLALRVGRPVAVVRHEPARHRDLWVIGQVPRHAGLSRTLVGVALTCADALERPLMLSCPLPTAPGRPRGQVDLEGRLPELPEEREALTRVAALLPEADLLPDVHVQLRRGRVVPELIAATRQLPADVAVVPGDAESLLIDRTHEHLLAAGLAAVVAVPLPAHRQLRARRRRRARVTVGAALLVAGAAALLERLVL